MSGTASSIKLQNRLVDYSVNAIEMTEMVKKNFTGRHLAKQLIRSSSSCALNYGEARSAESPKDFVHKMKLVLKELRESQINLQILSRTKSLPDSPELDKLQRENSELIAIFVSSINTASSKLP